ncbi:hypothetical protein EE612_022159 [Oryza sativa]|nr:hypothetical protein EE612_022159 [Oryza sativa]
MNALGWFSYSSAAFLTVPPIPFVGSVRTSFAPKALMVTLLSRLVYEGIVSMSSYPLRAAMNARPIPMFPDVGSISVVCSTGDLYIRYLITNYLVTCP